MRVILTEKAVSKFKPKASAYEVADAQVPGLSLRVLPSGVRAWSLRYKVAGRARRIALGLLSDLSLKDAREVASEHRRSIRKDGSDPSAERRAARETVADTFDALADSYIQQWAMKRKRTWKVDKAMLARDVPRSWRRRRPAEITRTDVRELIEDKARHAPIQANRLRALLHKLFAFAVSRDVVLYNPVTGTERPGVEHSRDRVLTDDEIRTFWAATEKMPAALRAFWRLRLATAQRQIEIASMTWADLDLAQRVWTIPSTISKNKLSHRVPLSDLALEIIGSLPRVVGEERVLAGALGNRQRYSAVRGLQIPDFKGHDLRRTAASCMASAGVPRLVVAKVLNHSEQGVTAVYDRHSYDAEKRTALETWERRLRAVLSGETGGAAVLPFSTARAGA